MRIAVRMTSDPLGGESLMKKLAAVIEHILSAGAGANWG